ncbi:hypothetical protein [Niabella ginsengisoli]|uniref:Uncharacterized protein n=1 Tax=Niabella ginsengisoli TaxID=522298 RepID=A0ABS9SK33_9BACT|nr:hypothetical protein [Niabella ginsengisoli]MCH5598700.1 hypothetical protein [Niabella ginsengisoli]
MGSKDGKQNVTKDSFEEARVYWKFKSKFEGKSESEISASDKYDYKMWLRAKEGIEKTNSNTQETEFLKLMSEVFREGDSVIRADLKKKFTHVKI